MPVKLTTQTFIEKARTVHGERYGYELVAYVNSATKVEIICPKHGSFWQKANSHTNGSGCDRCGGTAPHTTESFIAEARTIHGERYGYEQVTYLNGRKPVVIICPDHGEFKQSPKDHLSGRGCRPCGISRRAANSITGSTSSFIEQARAVHGDRYNYSLVEYRGTKSKVEVICADHGRFSQGAYEHLCGKGCNACGFIKGAAAQQLTNEQFIAKAQGVHGQRFDYSRTRYVKDKIKVVIVCPDHGEFKQDPGNHLAGQGCPQCGLIARSAARRKNEAEYFAEVALKHGGKYDYSKAALGANNKGKIEILCPEHGSILQQALGHWQGQGCPKCGLIANAKDWVAQQNGRKAFLYLIELSDEATGELFYKIGISFKFSARFRRKNMPYKWRTVALFKSYNADKIYAMECRIKIDFAHLRHFPKLPFAGQTECFSSAAEIIATLPPETFFLKNRPVI